MNEGSSSAAAEIVRVCRRLYAAGLIAGQDGNVSVRLPSGDVLVTPAGFCKVDVTEDDLIVMDIHGRQHLGQGRASSEVGMHLRIYQRRTDVHAVVHAHPPVATGFGVAGLDLMDDVLPEAIFLLGGVPLVPYATPGSPALGDSLEPYLPHHDGFLLANHGATTVGSSLMQAHQRMESLEHAARIMLTAKTLGRVNALAPGDAQTLRDARVAAHLASQQQTKTRSHETA
ncbi:MAG: class II aldolase/adducin family protein [Gemmatimonadota bacterium]|nr:class II aldolase/adducin family protein [Gemmatimonadota bacterium]